MKKTKIDRSIDTEALGFQVRESYKTARTNIAYSIFKKGCKKVAFTSSTKGEGKTVTSINVASALAQQVGTKVIVVECDLRRPRVNTAFFCKYSCTDLIRLTYTFFCHCFLIMTYCDILIYK